jgi:hypothetical protein
VRCRSISSSISPIVIVKRTDQPKSPRQTTRRRSDCVFAFPIPKGHRYRRDTSEGMLAHPATHPLERLVVGRHCQEMINEGRSFQVLQTLEPFILICRLLRLYWRCEHPRSHFARAMIKSVSLNSSGRSCTTEQNAHRAIPPPPGTPLPRYRS